MAPSLPAIGEGDQVLFGIVRDAGADQGPIALDVALELWLLFAQVGFDVPDVPDADGLLYQYGVFRFEGTEQFHLDLTRQFADPDGDEYWQVHLDVRLAPDSALAALGRYNDWWFPGRDTSLDAWGSSLRARPEWSVLRERQSNDVVIYLDQT